MTRYIDNYEIELEEFESDVAEGYVEMHIRGKSNINTVLIANHIKTIRWYKSLKPSDVVYLSNSANSMKKYRFCNEEEDSLTVEAVQ